MLDPQLIYIAIFERPADPEGLAYVNEASQGGTDLQGIGDLTQTYEFGSRFFDMTPTEIVSSLYESLFNRAPEAGGLEYWTSHFVNSTTGAGTHDGWTLAGLPFAMAQAAQNEDILTLQAKTDVSNYFTNEVLDTPLDVGSYAGADAIAWGNDFIGQVDWQYIPSHEEIQAAWDGYMAAHGPNVVGTTLD